MRVKRVIKTDQEVNEIWDFYYEFSKNPILNKVYSTPQHRTSNTYRHLCLVTKECIRRALRKHYDIDYHSLIRGAFLHDLFFYNWRVDKKSRKHHLTHHPAIALENAKKEFKDINKIEEDIILNHMWPITITKYPKSVEAKLVSLMDKKVTWLEFFNKKKKTLVFDLDGTLIDTIPDLNASINHMCEMCGYPKKDLEHTRISIGNGIKVLVRKSIPEGTSEEDYNKALEIFKEHYKDHSMVLSKPYPDMADVLRRLRKRGYKLAVVTNKNEDLAKAMINHYYPNIFMEIIGPNGKLKPKPSYDMINELRNRMKIRRRSMAVYIGDTEVDYIYAKRALLTPYIVTYGYRTKKELLDKKIVAHYVDEPLDLLGYFTK